MASTNLTDNDRKLLAAAWHCFETQPKVNFAKLADLMGYKNSQTASACFGPVKKKLLAFATTTEGGTPTPKKAAGKGKGKRAAEDVDGGDDAEDEILGGALKKRKSKKAKAEVSAEADKEGDKEGEGVKEADENREVVIKGEVEDD